MVTKKEFYFVLTYSDDCMTFDSFSKEEGRRRE